MIKTLLNKFKKLDYKAMYIAKTQECDNWEFKYNKLKRQLQAVLKENS
jgi:hypothetical protein